MEQKQMHESTYSSWNMLEPPTDSCKNRRSVFKMHFIRRCANCTPRVSPIRMFNETRPQSNDNEADSAAGRRWTRSAASVGSVAWPDLNVLCALSPPDMAAQDSSPLKTQSPSSHPSLSHPLWRGCLAGARLHWPLGGLNASPVTGWCQCQFSCYMHSGVRSGLHKETSERMGASSMHKL